MNQQPKNNSPSNILWTFISLPSYFQKYRSSRQYFYRNSECECMHGLIYNQDIHVFSCLRGNEWVNPVTLRVPLESVVCYSDTFENNLWMMCKFTKYLKGVCYLTSYQYFSFKCFQENNFVSKIFPKSSGLIWPLWV